VNYRAQKIVITTYLKQLYNEAEIEKWWTEKHKVLEAIPGELLYNGEYLELLSFVKSEIVSIEK
jgi:hypothetical protein